MSSYPGWTPAARTGAIPLRPLTWGEMFGRSFSALRQNPAVMLGFALGAQVLATLVGSVLVGFVIYTNVSRLATLTPSSAEWRDIESGLVLTTALTSLGVGLLVSLVTCVIQGVVAAQVAASMFGERARLAQLWARVRPVLGRLIGFMALLTLGATVLVLPAALLIGFGAASMNGVLLVIGPLLAFALIPLILWLSVRLLLVPSVYVLEQASFSDGLRRSWALTRGRWWRSFGLWIVIGIIVNVAASTVTTPVSILGGAFSGAFLPTGQTTAAALTGTLITLVVTMIISSVVGSIGFVLQSTAATLIYIDARMRDEGLDIRLLAHVDRISGGSTALADPWAYDPLNPITARPAPPWGTAWPAPYGQPGPYGQPSPYGQPAAYPGRPGHAAPGAPPPAPTGGAPTAWQPPTPPAPTDWQAPGGDRR